MNNLALADYKEQSVRPLLQYVEPVESASGEAVPVIERQPATLAVLYPLLQLGARPLAKTLVVSVESDVADIVMSNRKLRIFGVGDDVYQALEDFDRTFTQILESYANTPAEQMSPGAVEYLEELRSYLA